LSRIKELPKLLQLQTILMRHFCFRIDKTTASEITIEDAIRDTPEGKQFLTHVS